MRGLSSRRRSVPRQLPFRRPGGLEVGSGWISRDYTCHMPYTPILATLGYVLSPDRTKVLLVHRNARADDAHLGKYNGLGGKLERDEDVVAGMRREIREEAGIECTSLR